MTSPMPYWNITPAGLWSLCGTCSTRYGEHCRPDADNRDELEVNALHGFDVTIFLFFDFQSTRARDSEPKFLMIK
jgi:hypothetical protein